MRLRFVAAFIFLIPIQAMATCQGAFSLENGAVDISGNGRDGSLVGSPVFVTNTPGPIDGSYSLGACTDSDYVSLPSTVISGLGSTGTIDVGWMYPNGSTSVKVFLSATQSGHDFFIYAVSDGHFDIRMPYTVGTQQVSTAAGVFKIGRPYIVRIGWNGADWWIDLRDLSTTVYNRVYSNTAPGDIYFADATAVYLGRAQDGVTGFASNYQVDTVAFYDTNLTVDPGTFSYNSVYLFMHMGHSYVQGTLGTGVSCGVTSNADGYRWQWQLDTGAAAKPWYFAGPTAQTGQRGTVIAPYTAGVAGAKAADMLASANANVVATFITPTAQTIAIIGPIEFNDCGVPTNLDVFQAQVEATGNSIDAYSPIIPMVFVLGNSTVPCDITNYRARVQLAADNLKAAGKNVIGTIDMDDIASFVFCSDNIHPGGAAGEGYDQGGSYLYSQIATLLAPVVVNPAGGSPYLNNGIFITPRFRY